jgi:hypothetical protein
MIHEVGVDLLAYLAGKSCPFPVIDGPEIRGTTTYARERIVIEHDPAGDDFAPRHIAARTTPVTRITRNTGVKVTIYAKNPRVGAPYWEHIRRAEHVLDLVLCGLYAVAKMRQNLFVFKSGKFFFPPDLKDSETHGGAAYELLLTFDRGVAERNWDMSGPPTLTVGDGLIQNTVTATGETQDGGTSTETASGTGGT